MRNKFLFITIVSFLLIVAGIMTTIAMAHANTVEVQTEVLNVRNGPGLAYDVTSQVRKHDLLQVIGEENKWYKVRLSNGESGYVASWLVKNKDVSAASNSLATVTSDGGLNIRTSPSTSSESIGLLHKGDQVTVISQQNGWAQVQYKGKIAWINSSYITIKESATREKDSSLQQVTVRENATNIRETAALNSNILEKVDAGESFDIEGVQGDWYKVKTTNGQSGYIANWVVDISQKGDAAPKPKTTKLSEAVIVLDPGHGGNDPGTRGSDGIKEKNMTLKMANVVADKLRSSGAKVILTRSTDEYISLKSRADQSYEDKADAFISLHFDSNEEDDASVSGQTTYYYHNRDKELASSVNQALGKELPTPNRDTRVGDFYVLRENTQPSILLELGYLSSQKDEQNITSPGYRTQVANAVYDGLSNYFAN